MAVNLDKFAEIKNTINNLTHPCKLLLVSKNRKHEDVLTFISAGQIIFGENKVQEAKKKFIDTGLKQKFNLHLSLIGPLQSNKVTLALQIFDSILSVDRKKIIDEIVKTKNKSNLIHTKKFYIQVNIGQEDQKSGTDPRQIFELFDYAKSNGIEINGLMCIPPNISDPSFFFKQMQEIRDQLNPALELSMGMSNDYGIALKYGSNLIRIGSLLFND